MSVEDRSPRFVVVFRELPRFWSDTREGAEKLRQEGQKLLSGLAESHQEGGHKPLYDPAKSHVEEISGRSFRCPVPGHDKPLLFEHGGWVGCPECGKIWMA